MANSWFQFQQFKIEQGRSAMKVCTDSCLFAATVSSLNPDKILDVGAGTGLIGLMLAQKNEASVIHFVEPDKPSFLDLEQNIKNSPWFDRCFGYRTDLEDWAKTSFGQPYDLIVSNPPFFLNHLQSPTAHRNVAMHLDGKQWLSWVGHLSQLVGISGEIWLLLPGNGAEKMIEPFKDFDIHPFKLVIINQNGKPFRTFAGLKRKGEGAIEKAHLELRNPGGNLSKWASDLMKDFYLIPPTDSTKP